MLAKEYILIKYVIFLFKEKQYFSLLKKASLLYGTTIAVTTRTMKETMGSYLGTVVLRNAKVESGLEV